MSPLSANDPQRGPPLSLCVVACPPLSLPLLTSYFSATFPLFSYVQLSSTPLAHLLLPVASLFSQSCHTLCSFFFHRTLYGMWDVQLMLVGNSLASHLQMYLALFITPDSNSSIRGRLSSGECWRWFVKSPNLEHDTYRMLMFTLGIKTLCLAVFLMLSVAYVHA